MNLKLFLCLAFSFLAFSVEAKDNSFKFQSGPEKVNFIELYTSEGCSSCPSADRWFSKFKKDPNLFKKIIPLSFHVDYWDYLGWEDAFSTPQFTQRQRAYARDWKARTVYTPGVVYNGEEFRNWRRAKVDSSVKSKAGTLFVQNGKKKDSIIVKFKPHKSVTLKAPKVYAAYFLNGVQRKIKAGENKGENLTYDFAACQFASQSIKGKISKGFETRMTLSPCKKGLKGQKVGVVVWVQDGFKQNHIQAAAGWVSP